MLIRKTTNENLQCWFSVNKRVKNGKYRKSASHATMHLIVYPANSFYRKIICRNLFYISKSSLFDRSL